MTVSIGLGIAAFIIVAWIIYAYNGLIVLRNRVDNGWSQIDVQLRRRYDLIPNLVETVKGYAAHERQTFENVTKARAAAAAAKGVDDQAQAQNQITAALKTLFAVAENYPQLKANENFKMLQEELSATESKIAYARQFYNDTVMLYNTRIQVFPVVMIASIAGFARRPYFEMEEIAREPVRVSFTTPPAAPPSAGS